MVLISNLLIQAKGHILCPLGLFIIRPVSTRKKWSNFFISYCCDHFIFPVFLNPLSPGLNSLFGQKKGYIIWICQIRIDFFVDFRSFYMSIFKTRAFVPRAVVPVFSCRNSCPPRVTLELYWKLIKIDQPWSRPQNRLTGQTRDGTKRHGPELRAPGTRKKFF